LPRSPASLIQAYTHAELETSGSKGNFHSPSNEDLPGDGVILTATAASNTRGEYGYGTHPDPTYPFEDFLANQPEPISTLKSLVMIQCVGPGEKYCSRLCCTTAMKNALKFKELNPEGHVTILYRDIRTYGFKERLYTEARRAGVTFIHYDFDRRRRRFDQVRLLLRHGSLLGRIT
jgi:heterodisulfide reductase subunit A